MWLGLLIMLALIAGLIVWFVYVMRKQKEDK